MGFPHAHLLALSRPQPQPCSPAARLLGGPRGEVGFFGRPLSGWTDAAPKGCGLLAWSQVAALCQRSTQQFSSPGLQVQRMW